MNRDKKLKANRIRFVKMAIKDPRKGARYLRDLSFSLGSTKTNQDTIYALSQIFGVSERTIKRDLYDNNNTQQRKETDSNHGRIDG